MPLDPTSPRYVAQPPCVSPARRRALEARRFQRSRKLWQRENNFRAHAFELACAKAGIDHRTTKPKHPWTNGQAERMNRTIKDATVKAFHYEDLDSLKAHVLAFVAA